MKTVAASTNHLTASDAQTPHPGGVRVWDPVVRLFHWSLVTCVVLNQFILEDGEAAHEWAGYVALGLVLIRILWGFVGSTHARFANFVPRPTDVWQHLHALLQGEVPSSVGHNPLGALMMLALMALVLGLGVTGFAMGTDTFWGEEWLEELHEGLANVLLLSALVHALAAIVMGRLERVRLIRAMITGVKDPL